MELLICTWTVGLSVCFNRTRASFKITASEWNSMMCWPGYTSVVHPGVFSLSVPVHAVLPSTPPISTESSSSAGERHNFCNRRSSGFFES